MMPFTALRKMSFELKLSFDANGSVWSNWYFVDSETGKRYSLTENIILYNVKSGSDRFYLERAN